MRKLKQAAALIKEWALETKHRVIGEHMLSAIDHELYNAGLDEQGDVVISELDELRHTAYKTNPQRVEDRPAQAADHPMA